MDPATIRLIADLGIALIGLLVLAVARHRRRSHRDPRRFFPWSEKRTLSAQARGQCEHKPMLWRRCPKPGTEADHIIPWSRGGPTELWNGQLLCHRHNARKSNMVPGRFYRWRLDRRRAKY
ncbi:HNH endonuclease [Amycolatopsis sp. CA-230715]|uniref:HNH endonuclease n=1 Tax=Amycolatopsis sp. CA-230715 TaxID=2745196 RepID=UPI001C0246A6|nr:HNH endonuclease signature motif containing protein [Amycolatopsis sp. CA-230715]QWF85689.1 hypothetical protein HUW46_09169 [Amycolatopsis sp. CA-230715]